MGNYGCRHGTPDSGTGCRGRRRVGKEERAHTAHAEHPDQSQEEKEKKRRLREEISAEIALEKRPMLGLNLARFASRSEQEARHSTTRVRGKVNTGNPDWDTPLVGTPKKTQLYKSSFEEMYRLAD